MGASLAAFGLIRPGDQPQGGEWKRRTVVGARLSAELPKDAEKTGVELTAAAKKQVSEVQAAKLKIDNTIFRFSFMEYPDDTEVDLEKAAASAISNLTSSAGVSDVKFKRTEIKVSGIPGIRLEATYQYLGSSVQFWISLVGEGNRLWQASAIFKDSSEVAKRVLDSVRLEKSATP